MIEIKDDIGIVYFDVDDTLVLWGEKNNDITIKLDTEDGFIEHLKIHKKHVKKLKELKKKGKTIVVWSQGGWDWASTVVKALKIEDYVDLVISKPNEVYDDLGFFLWMPKVKFIKE